MLNHPWFRRTFRLAGYRYASVSAMSQHHVELRKSGVIRIIAPAVRYRERHAWHLERAARYRTGLRLAEGKRFVLDGRSISTPAWFTAPGAGLSGPEPGTVAGLLTDVGYLAISSSLDLYLADVERPVAQERTPGHLTAGLRDVVGRDVRLLSREAGAGDLVLVVVVPGLDRAGRGQRGGDPEVAR